MGKDGIPYCEKCYQKLFGVKCAYCNRYISGKVLQAGDNHHFHPTCARCTKCGDPFGDGEEMYLQGSAGKSFSRIISIKADGLNIRRVEFRILIKIKFQELVGWGIG